MYLGTLNSPYDSISVRSVGSIPGCCLKRFSRYFVIPPLIWSRLQLLAHAVSDVMLLMPVLQRGVGPAGVRAIPLPLCPVVELGIENIRKSLKKDKVFLVSKSILH